jgi:hypothetical protein
LSITGVDFISKPALMPHLSMYLRVSSRRLFSSGMQAVEAGNPLRWARQAPLSRCSCGAVLLPESFRGGCSVGVVTNSDDLSRTALVNGSTIPGQIFYRKPFYSLFAASHKRIERTSSRCVRPDKPVHGYAGLRSMNLHALFSSQRAPRRLNHHQQVPFENRARRVFIERHHLAVAHQSHHDGSRQRVGPYADFVAPMREALAMLGR